MRPDRRDEAMTAIFEAVAPCLPARVHLARDVAILTPDGPSRADFAVTPDGDVGTACDPSRVTSVICVSDTRPPRSAMPIVLSRAGVRCTWQIAFGPHVGYRGPLPVIYVRLLRDAASSERFYFRGITSGLPLCVGVSAAGDLELISVRLDPGDLTSDQWLGLSPGWRR